MIRPIYIYGHPVLRRKTKNFEDISTELNSLIVDMFETMKQAQGVGLAAPQIGISRNIFVIDTQEIVNKEKNEIGLKQAFINSEIISLDQETASYNEGCLSLPELRVDVERPISVELKYKDENWNDKIEHFEGINARVILHEFDHICGKLFIDKLSIAKKEMLKKTLKKISLGEFEKDYEIKLFKK